MVVGIKDILCLALLILSGILGLKLQSAQYAAKETQLIHEKLIAESKANNANIVATAQRQRQLDAEKYAKEINSINDKYADIASRGNRMQLEVKTYSDRLHTVSREAVETYAKAAGKVYGECRKEYLEMGQYASKLDAELDKVTKSPD